MLLQTLVISSAQARNPVFIAVDRADVLSALGVAMQVQRKHCYTVATLVGLHTTIAEMLG